MALDPGTRLGPYQIVAPLGAGGMGEVYKAEDTRLHRTVAIKVLPKHLADQPDMRQRFEREARAVSSLNHPHICALYDIGQQDGLDFLVMEYLEGESLTTRLARSQLPAEQVLRYAVEIASALDAAHRRGVLHRDLKPGNIMLTKAGAKLLDFGLAKLQDPGRGGNLVGLHEAALSLTQKGAILGTFQYMAPEQLEGKETDARSDIFSFGAVLYEMATARKAFEGRSQASVISAIMERDPPAPSRLQPMTPPALDRVLQRCLAKDPDQRWQTARDLMLELEWIAQAGSQAGVPAPVAAQRRGRQRLWMAGGALLALAGVAALVVASGLFRERPVEIGAVRFLLSPPEGTAIAPGLANPNMVVSPDGRKLALVAADNSGKTSLWIHTLGSLSTQRLEQTEGASLPFWSPDSQFVAYFAEEKLKRIAASGGAPQTICDARAGEGGTWNRDGAIVFAPAPDTPLYHVAAAGGAATPVTTLDQAQGEVSHRWPQFLPDRRHVLYLALTRRRDRSGVYLQMIGSPDRKLLLKTELRAAYAREGYLLFVRDGTILAQEVDLKRAQLKGEPVALAQEVNQNTVIGRAAFTLSENGVLAYRAGTLTRNTQLVWYNREGKRLGSVGEPGQYYQIALSRDDRLVALQRFEGKSGASDLWLLQLASGIFSRMTFGPFSATDPVWSPDSRRIAFRGNQDGTTSLYEIAVGGNVNLLHTDDNEKYVEDWSPDGRAVIYIDVNGKAVLTLPLAGERKPQVVLRSSFEKDEFHFSPDGRWVAYNSNESGKWEVYVASFPSFTDKRQVSSNGGCQALWRRDQKELFYLGLDGKIMAVDVKSGDTLETGVPKTLFQANLYVTPVIDQYAVTSDGQRFLVNEAVKLTAEQVTLVINWPADLRR